MASARSQADPATTRHERVEAPDFEVVRYFTRGVRFPRLIGRTPDGTRLWGGPYTTTQAVGGLFTLLALYVTRGLWAGGDLLTSFAVIIGGTCVAIYTLKFVRTGGRNPLMLAQGLLNVCLQPRLGRLDGRPLRPRQRRTITGTAVPARRHDTEPRRRGRGVTPHPVEHLVQHLVQPGGMSAAEPRTPPAASTSTAGPPLVLSNVGRLLATAPARERQRPDAAAGPTPAGRRPVGRSPAGYSTASRTAAG